MSALKTRPPTGRIPWPLILVEGGEKAGKSWMLAELSASDKVGQTYWIDLGEGSADEYGAIAGTRYLVVEHDGTYTAILRAVEEIRDLAGKALANGDPPIVLGIDSMTAEWDLLKDSATAEARGRLARKGRKVPDEGDDVQISMDLWNKTNSKHRRLMTMLMTFPGIAVITARGKDVASLDAAGRPIEGQKEYRVEGHKNLAFDASVWLRVSRDHPPMVIGARSVHAGIRPGVDKPRPAPGLTLEKVVFDVLRCVPAEAEVRALTEPKPTIDPTEEPTPPPLHTPAQRAHMHVLWGKLGFGSEPNRIKRLEITAKILGLDDLESSTTLTAEEADTVIGALEAQRAKRLEAADKAVES